MKKEGQNKNSRLTEAQYIKWINHNKSTCKIEEQHCGDHLKVWAIRVTDLPKSTLVNSRVPKNNRKTSYFEVNSKKYILHSMFSA